MNVIKVTTANLPFFKCKLTDTNSYRGVGLSVIDSRNSLFISTQRSQLWLAPDTVK